MKQHRHFLLVLLAVSIAAAGCSSSPSPVLPPTPLLKISDPKSVETLWFTRIGEGVGEQFIKLRPVFGSETGFGIDYKGNLLAFNVNNGQTLWQTQIAVPVSGALNLVDGRLLLGTSHAEVLALDPKNGKELWRTRVSSEVLSIPQSSEGMVVVRTIDGRLFGLDAETGTQRWIYDRTVPVLTLRGTSNPVVKDGLVIAGFDNGKLAALTLGEGTVLWETPVAVPRGRSELERVVDLDADPIVMGDVVYAATYQGRIACLQLESGRPIWVREMSVNTGISVDPYRVFVSDANGQVWALDRFNGSTLWKQDSLLRRSLTGPAQVEGHIVVGDYNGYLHWLSRDDGTIVARVRIAGDGLEDWYENTDDTDHITDPRILMRQYNILTDPLRERDTLYAVDRRGYLYAYRLDTP